MWRHHQCVFFALHWTWGSLKICESPLGAAAPVQNHWWACLASTCAMPSPLNLFFFCSFIKIDFRASVLFLNSVVGRREDIIGNDTQHRRWKIWPCHPTECDFLRVVSLIVFSPQTNNKVSRKVVKLNISRHYHIYSPSGVNDATSRKWRYNCSDDNTKKIKWDNEHCT